MFTIRGKRKRKSNSGEARRPARGRPMKRSTELAVPKDTSNSLLRQSRSQAIMAPLEQVDILSSIEQLPNELIQQIFFNCFVINLPRASLHLARALSTESTYNALILFAYFDDDGEHPVEDSMFLPATYIQLELSERVRLQREILSCRWLTLSRLKACMPALSRLSIVQAWHKEKKAEQHLIEGVPVDSQSEFEVALSNAEYRDRRQREIEISAQLPQLEDMEGLIWHFRVKRRLPVSIIDQKGIQSKGPNTSSYLPRIVTWTTTSEEGSDDFTMAVFKDVASGRSTLAARILPDWLVSSAPWTDEKLELLQLLREGSRFLKDRRPVLEVSHTALFDGMVSAIEEKHELALLTLLEIHNTVFEDIWSITGDDDYNSALITPLSLHPLPARVFHAAAKAGDMSSKFVWALIRGGLDAISKDDVVLTTWGVRGKRNGDKVAEFLLHHMSDTTNYDHHFQEYLFKYGSLNQNFSMSPSLPRAIRFAEELNYLQGGRRTFPVFDKRMKRCGLAN